MNDAQRLAAARLDPRWYQVGALVSLLAYGIASLGFDVTPTRAAVTIGSALVAQYVFTRLWRLETFDPRSALISSLSLCLLFRAPTHSLAVAAAILSIGSKFVLRVGGKHVFNPTNFGIVAMLLLSDRTWVSPGQWGNTAFFGFLILCLGSLVVFRAKRSDVTFAFLFSFAALQFGRATWLGDPLAIPLHRLESGALLLFSFFMISDPRTIPDTRVGRILFALLVALVGYKIQYILWRSDAIFFALAIVSLTTPVIDRVLRGRRYEWADHLAPLFGRIQPREEHHSVSIPAGGAGRTS